VNLVRDLLDLRRLEETGPIRRVDLDLRAVVDDVVVDLAPEAQSREVTVTTSGVEVALVHGDRDDLALAVRNLVANAIRYNQPGAASQSRSSRTPPVPW
jgi:signal transduction histidine kinase